MVDLTVADWLALLPKFSQRIDDMSFYDEVYKVVRCIPKGKVATYGQIARILNSPRAARAVG